LPTSLRPDPGSVRPPSSQSLPGWDEFVEDRLKEENQNLYAEALALMERELLTRVLTHTKGNKVRAARMLGISRAKLRGKMQSLGVAIKPPA
jgi:two-component system nitrogen regulation response regulator GlnG